MWRRFSQVSNVVRESHSIMMNHSNLRIKMFLTRLNVVDMIVLNYICFCLGNIVEAIIIIPLTHFIKLFFSKYSIVCVSSNFK